MVDWRGLIGVFVTGVVLGLIVLMYTKHHNDAYSCQTEQISSKTTVTYCTTK